MITFVVKRDFVKMAHQAYQN